MSAGLVRLWFMQVQGCLGYGTTQHRGQATRNSGGRSEYSMSFLAPLNHKEGIRSLHHKIQRRGDWRRGRKRRGGWERLFQALGLPAVCLPASMRCGWTGLETFLSARKGFSYCCLLCGAVEFLSWFHSKSQAASWPNETSCSWKRRDWKGGGVEGGLPFLIPSKRKGVGI